MSTNHPIKAYRERTGKTQEDVAAMLEVEPMTVSRWERGESVPRPGRLLAIKRKLGINPEQMIKHAIGANCES